MAKITYNNKNAIFFASLKKSVDSYFAQRGKKKTGNIHLYFKSVVLIAAAIVLYLMLLFTPLPVMVGIPASIIFGFVLACIGFNVMHDANHGSYSSRKWVNHSLGLTLNALGGNSFIWKQKHNIIHHTYTNIDGMDDDIAKSPFIRMCSTQRWAPAHKIQHLYTPLLYAFSSMIWVLYQDFEKYFKGKIVNTPLNKMSIADHIIFWISKILYVLFYMAIPVALLGWKLALLYFVCMHIGLGFTLSIVFQLAHVVEETEFTFVGEDDKQIENEWAVHQVRTTSNFSPGSKIVSWFAGGLNYQIEHHLFPRISHIHYPMLSKLVQEQCIAFQLPYNSIPTFMSAVNSHFRFIKMLGKNGKVL
ncbi:MAG: acyl-CoA desaturase [Chitinophagaceae bacterium]|nr:acyl-CoA desaturase [Chitinophagaceae bacterium]MCW5928686.1 acyl-CoA desaturase [Chitinophagaceae bacterium]